MPTFAADVLPDQSGRNLGRTGQEWNLHAQDLVVAGSFVSGTVATVAYSSTPEFNALSVSEFRITLTGNVTSSTLVGSVPSGYQKMLVFEIIQDGTGGRSFTWPTNVFGGVAIDSTATAGQRYIQMFRWDGTNAYAVAPGVYY